MADPFADLLSSFKGGSSSPGRNCDNNKNASLNDLLSSQSRLNTPLPKNSPSIAPSRTPESITVTSLTASQSLFDDLLAEPQEVPLQTTSQVKPETQTPLQKDDFDLAFDLFNSTPHVNIVQPQPNPIPEPQPLVDEVKDMEIARLMSLGISFDEAVHHYEKGILYEQLVDSQKQRRQRIRNEDSNVRPSTLRRDDSSNSPPALLSMASNLFNMGKEFIEDKLNPTLRPDNASPPHRYQFSDEIPRRRPHPRTHSRQSPLKTSSPQPNSQLPSIDSLSLCDQRPHSAPVAPSEDKRVSTPIIQETLLDFGNSPDQTTSPQIGISNFELTSFNEFKNKGVELFSSGDYHNALLEFEKSFNTLPAKYPLQIISLSNVISCQLKLGENSKALKSVNQALDLIKDASDSSNIIENSEPKRTYEQMLNKIQLKHAVLQEHVENYEMALSLYATLIAKGATEPKVMDGRRRCEKIVHPEKFKPPKATTPSTKPFVSAKSSSPVANSAAVSRVKEENKKQEKEEEERLRLLDVVDEKIKQWTKDQKDDLRYLLANLEPLLRWASWKEVSPQDLVMTKKVKICYLKAIAKTHPDKLPPDASLENVMIAENVFMILTCAWEVFKSKNNL
ncbi:unnamed protein product [Kluyveromyces dobzhanskii CBS 2104]|uniref:WGS project CCBQ000000000 data, contig 00009 n=1 Tax=Kluyveromyces dobzhanskii CBS 2104 TaxID=1427455 RepID=A0A0A8L361_9SACH|nr:unnamed protein product [Kluyveromyces dobzhanskii CBS 2104]